MIARYEALKDITTEQLVQEYDIIASNTVPSLNYYREELWRREQDAQTAVMLAFTRQVRDMTIAITIMTGLAVLLTVANVYLMISQT
jgi:hypothetical protein